MGTIVSLLLLLVFLSLGFILSRLGILAFNSKIDRIFSIALYLLLFSMGLRLGQSRSVISSLSLVGALAISSAVFTCTGTVLCHLLMGPVYRKIDSNGLYAGNPKTSAGVKTGPVSGTHRAAILVHNLKKPFVLLVLVVLGTFAGYFLPSVSVLADGSVATWILYVLLFIIGIQMAGSGSSLGKLIVQPAVLLLPLVTMAGTLLGSLGTLFFTGMSVGKALALGSGFGWYSLSGVLITNLGDPVLGAAAFLSNLLRETIAFLSVPLLYLTGRCESGIGISGATSMDVTLPVIEDTWGSEIIPLSVVHGVILSFLVPFLVPLFMSF